MVPGSTDTAVDKRATKQAVLNVLMSDAQQTKAM